MGRLYQQSSVNVCWINARDVNFYLKGGTDAKTATGNSSGRVGRKTTLGIMNGARL